MPANPGITAEVFSYLTGSVAHALTPTQKIRRRHPSFPTQSRGSEEAETDQPVQGVHCGKFNDQTLPCLLPLRLPI